MELEVKKRQSWKVKDIIKEWFVPGIVYWKNLKNNILIKFRKTDFIKLYKKAWSSTPITLKWEDFEQMVLIYKYQLEPVKDMLIHVDFLAIKAWEKVKASVQVVLEWVEKLQKQWLEADIITDKIEVEAIPSKLPHKIKVDVSELKDWDNISVWDVKLWKDVWIISDETEVIVTVYNPSEQKEEKEENTESDNEEETSEENEK